jgi:hypothetical protein
MYTEIRNLTPGTMFRLTGILIDLERRANNISEHKSGVFYNRVVEFNPNLGQTTHRVRIRFDADLAAGGPNTKSDVQPGEPCPLQF